MAPDLLVHGSARTPSIIELWFQASDRIVQFSSLAIVAMPASLDTYPEVKTSAASLPCKSASSCSVRPVDGCAGNIAGAGRTSAHAGRGFRRGANYFRAQDHDRPRAVRRMPDCVRETAGHALENARDCLSACRRTKRPRKEMIISHRRLSAGLYSTLQLRRSKQPATPIWSSAVHQGPDRGGKDRPRASLAKKPSAGRRTLARCLHPQGNRLK